MTFFNLSVRANGTLNTILFILNEEENRKLWELYLSFKPNKSFESWKKHVIDNIPGTYAYQNFGTKSKEETNRIVDDTKKILKKFRK